jgi:hypothetical protein
MTVRSVFPKATRLLRSDHHPDMQVDLADADAGVRASRRPIENFRQRENATAFGSYFDPNALACSIRWSGAK